jgi:uncharacterized membrane protein (DUF4010 family)
MNPSEMTGLIVAALGGAAVGLERQWSGHADGRSARFAGIRTFAMLGALGGLSGWLWTSGVSALAGILLAGGVAITTAAYIAASRHDVDGTTEVAALIVLAAGVMAGMGFLKVASGVIAVEVLLLVEKTRLHSLVQRIDDAEFRAGVRFAVMALVILPLLPEGPYPPFASVRPRQLWILVLFFSGLSFLGHVLHRLVGPGHGYLVSGTVGGLVSSTNVTFTFARSSRSEPKLARALAFGAVGANAVLYVRVLAATAVLNAALVPVLLPLLAAPAVVAALCALAGSRKRGREVVPALTARNPLQLSAALQMAALFQVVALVVHLAQRAWGQTGILTTAALLGLTDVDALTVSMATDVAKTASIDVAARAIAVGVLSNTALKAGVALVFGAHQFRLIVAGTLLLMVVAAAVSIGLLG